VEQARADGIAKAKETLEAAKSRLAAAEKSLLDKREAQRAADEARRQARIAKRVAAAKEREEDDGIAAFEAKKAACENDCESQGMVAEDSFPPQPRPEPVEPVDVSMPSKSGPMPAGMSGTCKQAQARTPGAKSGVFELQSVYSKKSFKVYCDMETANGGWMLAFKQANYESGSVQFNETLLGAASMSSDWGRLETTYGSLLSYADAKELLFVNAKDTSQWFVTHGLKAYDMWNAPGTSRYCLFRPYSADTEMKSSPKLTLWNDANVQLMLNQHPSVSAITVGRFKSAQHAPQCMAPQCSAERHGRYNGNCQNGAVGIGDWRVFVR